MCRILIVKVGNRHIYTVCITHAFTELEIFYYIGAIYTAISRPGSSKIFCGKHKGRWNSFYIIPKFQIPKIKFVNRIPVIGYADFLGSGQIKVIFAAAAALGFVRCFHGCGFIKFCSCRNGAAITIHPFIKLFAVRRG